MLLNLKCSGLAHAKSKVRCRPPPRPACRCRRLRKTGDLMFWGFQTRTIVLVLSGPSILHSICSVPMPWRTLSANLNSAACSDLSFGVVRDTTSSDPCAPTRSWKLWLFLPSMLLFRPAGIDRVPKQVILARCTAFCRRTKHHNLCLRSLCCSLE